MKGLTCCFLGHSFIFLSNVVYKYIFKTVEELILKGYENFLIGKHGDFDKMAFSVCLELKNKYRNIKIIRVLTNLSYLKQKREEDSYRGLIETMFYPIENVYFKNQIIVSNQYMIDDSDIIVSYVDLNARRSGAKKAVLYAKKQKKEIINLFEIHKKELEYLAKKTGDN